MLKKIILALFVSLVVFAIYVANYTGYYNPVELSSREEGPLYLIYKEHRGAYHGIGESIAAVEKWARDNGIPCPRSYGEFLDDPAAVDQDRLRSRGGCVLSRESPVTPPEDFHVDQKPRRLYVVARFQGAPGISPFTVYPKALAYIEEQRLKSDGPVIEIYSVSGASVLTEYLFPIAPPPAP